MEGRNRAHVGEEDDEDGATIPDVLLDAMVKVMDRNGDGKIDRDEYQALIQPMKRHSWTSRLRR